MVTSRLAWPDDSRELGNSILNCYSAPSIENELRWALDPDHPFDPALIRLDATFTLPSGRTMTVPAFWFQDYQRGLSGEYEYLTPLGAPGWRLRFMPPEQGDYSVSLTVVTNGQPSGPPVSARTDGPSVPFDRT